MRLDYAFKDKRKFLYKNNLLLIADMIEDFLNAIQGLKKLSDINENNISLNKNKNIYKMEQSTPKKGFRYTSQSPGVKAKERTKIRNNTLPYDCMED